jgi:uncharacterized protein (DUF1800 family)
MVRTLTPRWSPLADQAAPRTLSGLEPYPGPWNAIATGHLLRRTTFGPTRQEVLGAQSVSLDAVISSILQDSPPPAPPVDPTTGQTWVDKAFDSTLDSRYQGYLKAWWMGLVLNQGSSIREKMVLFWHNHFASAYSTVTDSRLMYTQNALLRRYALGNIKELVIAVTQDPAMLIYLNGYRNRGDGNNTPDENYGRELQELFTIGKGPQVGPGDYTNYTEQDVKAAAHLLTGWTTLSYRNTQSAAISSYFDTTRHDTKDKVFSQAYQGTRIVGSSDGLRELRDLIDMIFRQEETAKFLCRKLYRWFVYYLIDPAAEEQVIAPLATIMRRSNYEIIPVLDALFRSAHFFDGANIGCLIKNPVDVIAGGVRPLGVTASPAQPVPYYGLMASYANTSATLQMNLMELPNVAGWPAYYEIPTFHRLWINSITLPSRWAFTDSLVNGISAGGIRVTADVLALAGHLQVPSDPVQLVTELAAILFAGVISDAQKEYLVRNVLIPGLPDYEWTGYWNAYIQDAGNTQKRDAVANRLKALLKFMMRMAEFHLA